MNSYLSFAYKRSYVLVAHVNVKVGQQVLMMKFPVHMLGLKSTVGGVFNYGTVGPVKCTRIYFKYILNQYTVL